MQRLKWHIAAATDTGCRRQENQDNYYVSPDNIVFVVADGMGGERGGATASRLTVEAIEEFWKEQKPDLTQTESIEGWLAEAVDRANASVWQMSTKDSNMQGMGTTIVVGVQTDNCVHIAHVGDSRAYRVREGESKVLTRDHSVVMELFLQGKISEEQFRTSPFRNYITRCLGHNNKVTADCTHSVIEPGDIIILCTDGLSAVVSDEGIGAIAAELQEPEAICARLIKDTLEGGAPDNVTVVVVQYESVPSEKCEQLAAQ